MLPGVHPERAGCSPHCKLLWSSTPRSLSGTQPQQGTGNGHSRMNRSRTRPAGAASLAPHPVSATLEQCAVLSGPQPPCCHSSKREGPFFPCHADSMLPHTGQPRGGNRLIIIKQRHLSLDLVLLGRTSFPLDWAKVSGQR